MKKFLALLLAALMVLSMFAMVACQPSDDPVTPPDDETDPDNKNCTTHVDANTDYKCDNCGANLEKPDCTHEDADTDYVCDKCGAALEKPGVDPKDQEKADDVIERIQKIEEVTKDNYTKKKNTISTARSRYNKLTDAQKALVPAELVTFLEQAEAAYAAFVAAAEKAEALTVNKLIVETPRVDGQINIEYYMGAALSVTSEAGTTVTFRFMLDNEYLYIIEDRKDATPNWAADYNAQGDNAVIYFVKDTVQVSGLYWNASTAKSETPVIALFATDKAAAAVKSYEANVVAVEGASYVMEAKIALADLGLTKDDFDDSLVGVTFCAYDADGSAVNELKYAGVDAWEDCQRFFTAKSEHVNFIANGSAVIDGRIDELYWQSSYIELSQSACNDFTDTDKANGAGIVGAPELATPDFELMHSTFRFAIDGEYLYIVEHRYDLVPIYKSLSFKTPYTADGSLLWFVTNGGPTVGIQWNRATMDSNKPILGLFFNGNEPAGVEMDWECVVKNCGTEFEYIMEAKVPLADLKLTREQFENNEVGFTCCTVDIINPQYDPANFAFTENGYQLQYIGVGKWGASPKLMINPNGAEVGYVPEVGEYDPEFDLGEPEDAEKPFDTVPIDPETGYLTTEYRYNQYAYWYSDMKREEILFTKASPDVFEGVVVDTSTKNPGVGLYTDGDRQYVMKIDLKKYKDAIIVLELAQNYDVRVSTDAAIESLDPSEMYDYSGWLKVQDYVDVYGERTTSGSLHHAIAIESSAFAGGEDYLYIRIGNCGNENGHGGSCYNFSIFYEE